METQVNLSITGATDEMMWADDVFPGQRASSAKVLETKGARPYQEETHGHCVQSSVWKLMDRQPLSGVVGAT